MDMTILYNPKCGTCQKVRAAVEAKGYKPRLIEYLKTPPSVQELDAICKKLGLEPQAIAREKEPIYEATAARCKTRQDWLKALHDNPVLIQRPIVVLGDRAIIARPPESIETFI
jgi:arsenate reductase (glutaredoxin)